MQQQRVANEATAQAPGTSERAGQRAPERRAALAGRGFAEQEAMMAPGGALDGAVQLKVEDPAQECGPYKQRYGDPAPYAWSVAYKRNGLGEGHFDKGAKQDVTVEAKYDWAMLNQSNTKPRVVGLVGNVTSTTTEGRKEVDRESEAVDCTVEDNVARFAKAAKDGELFARKGTKVKAKGPKETAEADVEKCS